MALKYYAYFNSTAWAGVTSTRYKIEIYDTTFSGTATEVTTGANPFSEKELNNEETTYGIKSCRFDIDIVSDVVTVEDFYTQEGMSHRVKLYEAPLVGDMTLIRDGYLLSEDVQEVYQDGIKVIQLSGTDGLELLKTIPFEFSADKPYTGVMTALLLLDRCITPIGLELNVNTSFNYYQDGQSKIASFEPLAFFNVHAPLFKGKTCYEALTMLCETLRCVIFQEDGEWWFVHTLNPDNTTQYYRKWDSDFNSLSNGTLPSAITVEFEGEYAPCNDPKKLKKRSYKSVTTDVDIQDYINKLRNPDFTSGITEWVDGGVDSYASGGDGTNLNPYYLQINGYQNKTALDFLNIKYVSQNVATLYDVTTDDSISGKLDTSIKVSGKVLGNGVKFGNVGLFLRIETDSPLAPNLILCLSDSGEWIHLGLTQAAGLSGVLDVISGIKFNILKNIISIPLTDSDGVQIDDWKGFEIESKNISEIVLNMNKSIGFIDNIIGGALEQFYQIDVEDFTKVELYMVIYEGYDNTVGSSDPRNIKYGNLNLEIKDKSRLVGLKKDRYFSEQSNSAPNKLEVNAYFSDFQDNTQLISMLQSDEVTPTILWEDSSGNNVGELMMGLNRELLSLYYKPTSLYDGDILGKVKKYHKINLVEFANELINLNWNFDFGEGIASGVRYIMTFANYGTFTNTKYGIYSDDKQIKYDGNYPTGIYEFDQVPALKPDLIARNLLEIKASSLFSDGYATFSKINPKSGIQWFDAANNKTDYFLTTEDGFVMKSETNPYEVTLDFTELTANTKLIIPPLSADAYLLTSENGWVLEGNNISTAKKLGSTTAQDWTIIHTDTTIATVNSSGINLGENLLTSGGVQFDLTSTQTAAIGKVLWDDDFNTLQLGITSSYDYEFGQAGWWYCKAGQAITKGDVLYASGAVGASGKIEVSKFIANGTIDESLLVGVAAQSASSGDFFPVVMRGEIRGINTSAYSVGDTLYASTSTAGAFQSTLPTAPNKKLPIAFVVTSHASNGAIYIRAYQQGLTLGKLHDINISSVADKNILFYSNSNARWENGTLSSIGAFATPSGLTTNYVTKWNGTALANSLIFDNGTNVGIGTATLDTVASHRSLSMFGSGGAYAMLESTNNKAFFGLTDSGNVSVWSVNRNPLSGTIDNAGLSNAAIRIFTNNSDSYITFSTGIDNAANSGEKVRINSSGNVGIGTTTPVSNLTINGSIGLYLRHSSGGKIIFDDTDVADASTPMSWIEGANGAINFYRANRNASTGVTTGSTQSMVINVAGNVGIGTTSPSYKLDVSGTGHFTGAVTFDTVPSSLQDATTSNHLVRYSQFIAATAIKYLPTAVKTVSLTNITLSGTQTVNGVALIATDRILVAGQTAGAENGVWVVAAGAWSRATDSDTDGELRGYIVSVSNGTYAGYKYINTNASAITVGTTAITYSEFSNNIEIDPVFVAWRDTTRTANTFWAAPNGLNGAATWRALVAADVPTLNQSTTGSAATLTTSRNIAISGDATWSVSFNGSADVTSALTLATVNSNVGTFAGITVNGKGLVTGATALTTLAGYGIIDAQPLNSSLTNLAALAVSTGIMVQTTGDGQFVVRSLTGTTDRITVSNGNGGAGNPTIDISSSYVGQSSITTLGTITTGTWNGGVIPILYGGTGSSTQNFVDLSTSDQEVTARKYFYAGIKFRDVLSTLTTISRGTYSRSGGLTQALTSSAVNIGLSASGFTAISNGDNIKALYGDAGLLLGDSLDYTVFASERLQVNGNIRYNTLLKPNNVAGTNGQFLGTSGTQDVWTTLTTSHISNLSSYTGFTNYFTETEADARFAPISHTLDSHSNVTITSNSSGEILKWNGTAWINNTLAEAGIQPLDDTLTSLAALTVSTGILVQTTGDSQFVLRSITGTTNRVSVSNGNGGAGNPTIDIASTYVGQTSITTLGTISTGTWNGTTIGYAYGGTGLTALGTAGQLLKVNSGTTALEYFTPTYISANQTITLSGVITGSGTTAITTSIADGTLSIAKTSGLQSALDGKQATLPSGTAGQFFVRDSTGALNFMDLKIKPIGLSSERIGVGNVDNFLGEQPFFLFKDKRYIQVSRITDSTKQLNIGLIKKSNNGFIEQVGGSLNITATGGLYMTDFASPNRPLSMLTIDSLGKLSVSSISGGGALQASLTSTHVGYGVNNVLGSSANFTYLSDRYLHFTGSSANVNIGATSSGTAGFLESLNGNLLLQARSTFGVVVDDGFFQVNDLAGTGTRMVVVDNNGKFDTQTIPSGGGSQDIDDVLSIGDTVYDKTIYFETPISGHYINFKDDSSNLLGGIRSNTGTPNDLAFFTSTGYDLRVDSAENLILVGDDITIGRLNTTTVINLHGSPFNFNEGSQNGGSGEDGSQWGSGFNQTTPQAGDRILFFYDGTRWVPSHIHTYAGAGGKTYLTID